MWIIRFSKTSTLFLTTIAIILAPASAVAAQQVRSKASPVAAQTEKEIEQRQGFEKKTLALLNEVASAAWSLKLPENRIFVMTSAADLLWAFDEKRARNLYWEPSVSMFQFF